jgi:succinyl-CoA synthetase beta subunit
MYECFLQRDCLNITINPLALTAKHDLIGVNCRIEIDDNAEYRQQEMFAINDKS